MKPALANMPNKLMLMFTISLILLTLSLNNVTNQEYGEMEANVE